MKINVTLMCDFYKLGHAFQAPKGVSFVYTGWTARSNKYMPHTDYSVVYGNQGFIKNYLIDLFNDNFFNADIDEIQKDFERKIRTQFSPIYADFTRFRNLHKLGYLPIEIMALPEGTLCPIRVPDHVIFNTLPEYSWLPQYLDDIWAIHHWGPATCATIAYDRRQILQKYVDISCDDTSITRNLAGDFSMRGTMHEEAAFANGSGHLLSFTKTATVETNGYLEQFYGADVTKEQVGVGTPSLEHSVVCQGVAYYSDILLNGGEYKGIKLSDYPDVDIKTVAEMCFIKYLITEVQPTGPLSYVSDTYDYWTLLTWILPRLKTDIENRDGCFIVRPDSGDPVNIVCGYRVYSDFANLKEAFYSDKDKVIKTSCYHNLDTDEYYTIVNNDGNFGFGRKLMKCEVDGSIKTLEKIFGSTVNKKGYKVLPSYIRLIYGDAINRERNIEIPEGLLANGYSVENVTFGIGAYSYQLISRDSLGYALKATCSVINGKELPMFKDPKTDDGTKKSQKGCFAVYYDSFGNIVFKDGLTFEEAYNYPGNLLRTVFKDGKLYNEQTLSDIRNRLHNNKF